MTRGPEPVHLEDRTRPGAGALCEPRGAQAPALWSSRARASHLPCRQANKEPAAIKVSHRPCLKSHRSSGSVGPILIKNAKFFYLFAIWPLGGPGYFKKGLPVSRSIFCYRLLNSDNF